MISNYERDISSALRRGRRSSYMRSKQRVNYIRESINVGRTKERYSGVDGSIFLRRQSDKLSVFRLRRNSLFLLSPLAFSLAPCDKGATRSYFFFAPATLLLLCGNSRSTTTGNSQLYKLQV